MAHFDQVANLDGTTAFSLLGVDWAWGNGSRIPILSLGNGNAADSYHLTMNLTGGPWQVLHMRLSEVNVKATITDSNDGVERRIDHLRLGDGGTTLVLHGSRVRTITAFDTESNSLTMGRARTTTIELFDGNDTVVGGSGQIGYLAMGEGNNRLTAGTGLIRLAETGSGNDTVTGGAGTQIRALELGGGNDQVTLSGGRIGQLRSNGGDLKLAVSGEAAVDLVQVAGGNSTVTAAGASSVLSLRTGLGTHALTTAAGHTEAYRNAGGAVTLTIGKGGISDITLSGGGADKITATGWVDVLQAARSETAVNATLRGGVITAITGEAGDTITLGAVDSGVIQTRGGNDTVKLGKGGVESLHLGAGDDTVTSNGLASGKHIAVFGGAGADTVNFAAVTRTMQIDLRIMDHQSIIDQANGALGWWAFNGVENLIGGTKVDVFEGNHLNNRLEGRAGADRLSGGGGNDTLVGGKGADVLSGAQGADVFVFAPGDGKDRITDFEIGIDRLQFTNARSLADVKFTVKGDDVLVSVGNVSVLVEDVTRAEIRDIDNFLF